jgi:hypothetical protein
MAEPVEIRIRPHHYDGDVLVAHVEFPQGDPGAGSGATSKFVISNVAEFDIPDDGPHRIAFDSANPSYFGGYEFENFGMGNVTEIPVDKGPHFIRLVPDWQFQNLVSAGFVQAQVVLVDATGADYSFLSYNFHQYSDGQGVNPGMEMVYFPEDGMHLELEVLASGLGETPNFIAKFELAKL